MHLTQRVNKGLVAAIATFLLQACAAHRGVATPEVYDCTPDLARIAEAKGNYEKLRQGQADVAVQTARREVWGNSISGHWNEAEVNKAVSEWRLSIASADAKNCPVDEAKATLFNRDNSLGSGTNAALTSAKKSSTPGGFQ